MYLPSAFLFSSTLILGSMMAISSSNWLYAWMGLELNLLSMVPMMTMSPLVQETEAAVKYFLIQTVGSASLLTSTLSLSSAPLLNSSLLLFSLIMISSLALKLGAAPFHWWLPPVMSSIPWTQCMIMATWQKVAPLGLISSVSPFSHNFIIISTMAAMSAMVGGIGGLNQTHMRSLLAFSSIGHLGWMITASVISINMTWIYFFIYSVINVSIMLSMMVSNQVYTSLSNTMNFTHPLIFMAIMIMMCSLGGLPPFLGFIPKWFMIYSMMAQNMAILTSILILGSILNLFYYLSMMFNFLLSPTSHLSLPNLPYKLYTQVAWLFLISSTPAILFI
uniref:NADH-ubiquinone oxidoreductase chain 2 n=1 Tax=Paraleonnates uschakovi TaxID=1922336 RepID=A0A343A8S1_9ANNE|nr:NADH dehydrogenase subunit 2 [Paraleonnates uschakovi]APG32421.1 NADH dehydrogenase subunit 2 [Paraleonnates uschakovi]